MAPVALGRFGVRSPSMYGTSTSPSAPAGADRASRDNSSWSTPSMRVAASSTRAALSVTTIGRNRPVQSANPATLPLGSVGATSLETNTVPEVPIETTTSPGSAPVPRPAAALSPAPGPSGAPDGSVPATPVGPSTSGVPMTRPKPSSSRSGRYRLVTADQYRVPLASLR